MAYCESRSVSHCRDEGRVDVERRNYVNSVIEKLPQENLHLNTEIVAISSNNDGTGVTLEEASGAKHVYDHVILAYVAAVAR